MNTKEELGFIQMWFEDIKEMARTRRNANRVLISPTYMLDEISVKAKDAAEYVAEMIKELEV